VEKLLMQRRLLGEDASADPDPLEANDPLLSRLYSASMQGRIAAGPRAGQRLVRLGDRIDVEELEAISGPRCASVRGFSLHADVCVPARDRLRLQRLCRYVGRPLLPPIASPSSPTDESSIASGIAGATGPPTSPSSPSIWWPDWRRWCRHRGPTRCAITAFWRLAPDGGM
jgi:hypothetical protein